MARINATADTTTLTADLTRLTADFDPYVLPTSWATREVSYYLERITPWQAIDTKVKFRATVAGNLQPLSDAQHGASTLPAAFDIDLAGGAQLDVVGSWIGRSRIVAVPIPGNFFSFDVANIGWDQGLWMGPYDGADGLAQLPDDLYRRVLYAKRAANSWDGTADGAEAIVRGFFEDPATEVFVQDDARAIVPPNYFAFDTPGQGWDEAVWYAGGASLPYFAWDTRGRGWDQGSWYLPGENPYVPDGLGIAYTIGIAGRLPSSLELHVLARDLIPLQSGATSLTYAVTTVDGAPLFGFDMDDDKVSGFDMGAWGADPAAVAELIS